MKSHSLYSRSCSWGCFSNHWAAYQQEVFARFPWARSSAAAARTSWEATPWPRRLSSTKVWSMSATPSSPVGKVISASSLPSSPRAKIRPGSFWNSIQNSPFPFSFRLPHFPGKVKGNCAGRHFLLQWGQSDTRERMCLP